MNRASTGAARASAAVTRVDQRDRANDGARSRGRNRYFGTPPWAWKRTGPASSGARGWGVDPCDGPPWTPGLEREPPRPGVKPQPRRQRSGSASCLQQRAGSASL